MESENIPLPNEKQVAFTEELYSLRGQLHRIALGYTNGKEHDAEDLVQQTFFNALRAKDRFEDGTNMFAWTCRILQRLAITRAHKAKSRRTETDIDSNFTEILQASETTDRSPEINYELLPDRVKRAIEALNPLYREALLLRYSGKTSEEIANTLKVPLSTALTRVHRAIEGIRDFIRVDDKLPKLGDIL
jgi:RNA polymerase sigma-70 factor (ECF subfamily)